MFVALALAFAATAALVAGWMVRAAAETARVVVAARDIAPMEELKAENLTVADAPAASAAGALKSVGEAAGKYARGLILKGEVVRKGHLADAAPGGGTLAVQLTEMARPEIRAFALPVDLVSGVGGRVEKGDRVDVVCALKVEVGGAQGALSKVILPAVPVLDVVRQEGKPAAVVLALTPEQIEDVLFASTQGALRLALNPLKSSEQAADTRGVTAQTFLAKYGFALQGGGGK